MKSRIAKLGLAVASLAIAAACGKPYEVSTPDGFVELTDGARTYDRGADEYRASTADGVVVGIRSWDNEPTVDLALAVRALENRIRLGEGYALLSKKDASAKDGTKGVRLDFGHDEGSEPYLYTIVVFVTKDHVHLVESGGKRDLVERARPSIDWFIQNFDPD
ncbi:MAG: serine/threonine protein kinase [Polyangiaceae bacterium]|nr:serine/threonine protein kinase [Polyangiaceae bacterium]MBK8938970.1 serine/threonine protein kinase [Polyangiaceae bacterium]